MPHSETDKPAAPVVPPASATAAGDAAARKKAAAAERKRKAAAEAARIASLPPIPAPHEKNWPWSEGGMTGNRKKKPMILAVTTENCTGCAGSQIGRAHV